MNDIRKIIDLLESKELLERKAYKVKKDGSGIDNFNVNRDDPKIQIKRKKDGKVFDLHYKSEDQLEKGLANEKGFERFEAGKGEAAKGGKEDLDAIVAKYAKPGMTVADIAKMEQEAGSKSNATYVLAYAAQTLGLDGLYNSKGKFIYMDNGKPTGASMANLRQMQDLADAGLLPDDKIEKAKKVADKYKESDPEKSERFQKVVDVAGGATGGDDGSDQDDGAGEEPKGKVATGKINNDNAAKMIARYNDLIVKGKKKGESWQPKTFAEQLLQQLNEELSDEETSELQNMVLDFGQAVKDDSLQPEYKREIQRILDKWEQDKKDIGLFKDGEEPKGDEAEPAMDYSSDEAIKKAIDDVESWIANEFPKELESKQAKGLLKATNRGKIKSASAAAIQTVLMRIGTATNNEELKKIKADGFYGPASIAGVKRAQEIAGIKVDGDPGADTARELLAYSKDPQKGIDDAMKDDFARIEELIAKANEGGETEKLAQQNQSVDFSMRAMLETLSKLNEALTADEFKELRGLLDKHRAKITDPEVGPAYAQYKDIFDKADAIKDPETPKGNDTEIKGEEDIKSHEDVAEVIYAAMKKGTNFMFGTDEQAVLAALGKIKDANSFAKLQKVYTEKYNASLQDHIEEEFSGTDLDQVMGIVNKLGGFAGTVAGGSTGEQGKVNQQGFFAIPDASRADLKLDDQKPKFANTTLSKNGKIIYIHHDPAGKSSGPTIQVSSKEGQKLIKMIQDAGGKIVNPAAEKPKGDEVPKTPQGMDPNKLANPKPEGPGPLAKKAPTQQQLDKRANTMAFQSKDYSMKNPINEAASMNISMSGDNAGEVGELLKILKNAGMEGAAPVGAIDMPMDTQVKAIPGGAAIDIDKDGADDMEVGPMPCATCGGDHDADSPCGGGEGWDNSPDETEGELSDIVKLSGGPNSNKNPGDIRVKDPSPYEDVEEDGWDNSPDEEYKDDDYMYQSGGIHKKKKAYKAAQDGDNAMAVENSIKAQLYKALAEKLSEVK